MTDGSLPFWLCAELQPALVKLNLRDHEERPRTKPPAGEFKHLQLQSLHAADPENDQRREKPASLASQDPGHSLRLLRLGSAIHW
jgi:hypothetical protein